MKKWLITIAVSFLTIFAASGYWLYNDVTGSVPQVEGAKQLVYDETTVTSITERERYHGEKAFDVFYGYDDNGEEQIVWVKESEDEDKDTQIVQRREADGWSKAEVQEHVESELAVQELKDIRLGMIQTTPVYEVIYIDDQGRFSYYYLRFSDGQYIRQYHIRNT
ncbi:DUF5590 domain-containing protein [Texcoconibacillus texcoconensis]|nr:DUF5590 domain-containing protein [Texcoconibacillus texcoconensis]